LWCKNRIHKQNVINDEENYDINQQKKVRIIDPLVLVGNGRMKKATDLSTKVKELNHYALEKSLKGVVPAKLTPPAIRKCQRLYYVV
jgi:hypothetical protein